LSRALNRCFTFKFKIFNLKSRKRRKIIKLKFIFFEKTAYFSATGAAEKFLNRFRQSCIVCKAWLNGKLSEILKPKAPYLFVVAAAFFGYLLFVVQNSFQAEYRIYMDNIASIMKGNFWSLFTVISEFSGDVGLFLRFAGACFFVAFTVILWIKGNFQLSILRKTIILEAVFYMFNIPFDINLLTRPPIDSYSQTLFRETAVSYILQMLLISTTLILLYTKMRKPNVERTELFRYGALAVTAYAFSLWVKHFFFNIYALPISFSNPVLLTSFLNSTLTILTAALITMVTLLPVIRGKTTNFNQTAFGVGLTLIGVYFIIYLILCTLNATIHAFLPLIELWAITLSVLGVAFIAPMAASKLIKIIGTSQVS
jgi:hypothetical protein